MTPSLAPGAQTETSSPASSPVASAPIGSELQRALDDEVQRIIDIKLRGWQLLGLFIVLVSGSMLILGDGSHGYAPLIPCAGGVLLAAWATVERALALRGGARWVAFVHSAIELTAPWLMLLFITEKIGVVSGLHAWAPAVIFAATLVLSSVHMRLWLPIIGAVVGVAQYAAIWFLLIRPNLAPAEVPDLSPEHPVGRMIQLLGLGVTAGFVAHGLRRAVGGAARTVRARDLFGKYRLEGEIAHGGMGTVHKATYCPEGGFRRPVAVKLIHPHLASDPRFVEAFRNEAELCARLLHHNIVQTLDFGRVDDTYFIAMELVEGPTLRALFRRARAAQVQVPPAVVGAIGHMILAGLHHAHKEALGDDGRPLHVIHRDLGLENILIHHTGVVKVSDFGIARALREAQSTLTGTVVGHSDHMAPEQANADALDERCDLFCVGILLWELLYGEPLFTRNSDAASLIAILQAPIKPPSSKDPALAPWDAFFVKALARPKEQRFQSAHEMGRALHDVVAASASSSSSSSRSSSNAAARTASEQHGGGPDDVAAFLAALPPDEVAGADVTLRLPGTPAAAVGAPDDTAATLVDERAR